MGNSESYNNSLISCSSKSELTQSVIATPSYLRQYKREEWYSASKIQRYYKRSSSFNSDCPSSSSSADMSRKLPGWKGSQRRHKAAQWNALEKEKRMAEQRERLFSAITSGEEDTVAQMLARGVDVNSYDENHLTALHYAAMHAKPRLITLLIDHGANPDASDLKGGFSPIHWVVINSNPGMGNSQRVCECLDALVRGGCNINSRDFNQATPLHFAARKDDEIVVDALMKLGANPNDVDVLGRTCASVAKSEHTKILIIKLADLRARAIYHVLEIPPCV